MTTSWQALPILDRQETALCFPTAGESGPEAGPEAGAPLDFRRSWSVKETGLDAWDLDES